MSVDVVFSYGLGSPCQFDTPALPLANPMLSGRRLDARFGVSPLPLATSDKAP